MAEPFKNQFNRDVIAELANALTKTAGSFDAEAFLHAACHDLESLELKARSHQITEALVTHLPDPKTGAQALLSTELTGWIVMPMAEYFTRTGLERFDDALSDLAQITPRFTAEFSVRAFLAHDQPRALVHFTRWAKDEDEHVRRLASEGLRPYLPWGQNLPQIAADPSPVLPILEVLRDDPSEYVRRSVANCLNDIARDHPDLVARLAKTWLQDASTEREKLVRHALRSLIKAGHPGALKALGFGPPELEASLGCASGTLQLGNALELTAELTSKSAEPQKLVIDFALHLMKKNGKLAPKVFKWTTLTLRAGETREIAKKHAIKPVTTRVYYPGAQRIELLINGQSFGEVGFELQV